MDPFNHVMFVVLWKILLYASLVVYINGGGGNYKYIKLNETDILQAVACFPNYSCNYKARESFWCKAGSGVI